MYEPANYGKRVVAALIDYGIVLGAGLALGIIGAFLLLAAGFGIVVWIITPLVLLGISVWNSVIRQGNTGQSLGKSHQQISIIRLDTNAVPGPGWMILRGLLFWFFNTITGGLFLIVDYLYPVWDKNGQRIVDKMLRTQVIGGSGNSAGSALPPPFTHVDSDPFA